MSAGRRHPARLREPPGHSRSAGDLPRHPECARPGENGGYRPVHAAIGAGTGTTSEDPPELAAAPLIEAQARMVHQAVIAPSHVILVVLKVCRRGAAAAAR